MINYYLTINQWFDTTAGQSVISAIDQKLTPILNQLRGEHLLQIGVERRFWHYNFFRYQHVHILSNSIRAEYASIITDLESLPFQSESMDCVIAPFTFEICDNDELLLNELDRIINPMGYLILIGINPWGLWGKLKPNKQHNEFIKGKKRMVSAITLRQRLVKLGYNVQLVDSFYYLPPVASDPLREKLSILNEVGKMIWPIPGGFYLVLAQKFQLDLLTPEPIKSKQVVIGNQKVSPI